MECKEKCSSASPVFILIDKDFILTLLICFALQIICYHGNSFLLTGLWFVLQAGSNEHDDNEELVQGMCAFLMGICINFNDDTVTSFSKVRYTK
jgi:hypothetical protein